MQERGGLEKGGRLGRWDGRWVSAGPAPGRTDLMLSARVMAATNGMEAVRSIGVDDDGVWWW